MSHRFLLRDFWWNRAWRLYLVAHLTAAEFKRTWRWLFGDGSMPVVLPTEPRPIAKADRIKAINSDPSSLVALPDTPENCLAALLAQVGGFGTGSSTDNN